MPFPVDTFRQCETPFYAYDMGLLRTTLNTINRCLESRPAFKVHYAVKANNDAAIMRLIASAGMGADCVSGGEITHAISCGFSPDSVVYAGVGKTDREIALALDSDIACFNVESLPELENINRLAAQANTSARVALRINPNIDAHTHRSITTGTYEDQFGIPLDHLRQALQAAGSLSNVTLIGLHFHIGSQMLVMDSYRLLIDLVNRLNKELQLQGIRLQWINVGGGLGVDYDNPDAHPIADFGTYFATFDAVELSDGQQLHFELGRSVVAQCGSLITRVIYIKESVTKTFAIIDAGFSDLIRPALYGASHRIDVLEGSQTPTAVYDIVGPICESTDCFARKISLPVLERGSLLAIRSAGAYGMSMASTYNMRRVPDAFYFNL